MTEETIAHIEAIVQEHGSDAWWTFEARPPNLHMIVHNWTHRWAIEPQFAEQLRIVLSIFRESAPTIQRECTAQLGCYSCDRVCPRPCQAAQRRESLLCACRLWTYCQRSTRLRPSSWFEELTRWMCGSTQAPRGLLCAARTRASRTLRISTWKAVTSTGACRRFVCTAVVALLCIASTLQLISDHPNISFDNRGCFQLCCVLSGCVPCSARVREGRSVAMSRSE